MSNSGPLPTRTRLFRADRRAEFVSRPNRFLVVARLGGRQVEAHCPDPGRLLELLLPGRQVVLERRPGAGRRTPFTLVAVEYRGTVVPLDPSRSNELVAQLILPHRFPGWQVRREVRVGGSRLDFLLHSPAGPRGVGHRHYLEVKTCSLVEYGLAMFPDAPTQRGRRHLEQLAELAGPEASAEVLFLVTHPQTRHFMANLHTDPAFAATLSAVSDRVQISAVAIGVDRDGWAAVSSPGVPVEVAATIGGGPVGGAFLLLERSATAARRAPLLSTWVLAVDAADVGRAARLAVRPRRRPGTEVQKLVAAAGGARALPIRAQPPLACRLATDLGRLARPGPRGLGTQGCSCPTHLFHWPGEPLGDPRFLDLLARYRHVHAFDTVASDG